MPLAVNFNIAHVSFQYESMFYFVATRVTSTSEVLMNHTNVLNSVNLKKLTSTISIFNYNNLIN